MSKDYYKILGVSKSASQDEIKTAFRKLAHQHHPDKQGGNAEKFKEINEANQVLSDPQKRSQYDQFGSGFEQAGMGGGGGTGGAYGGYGNAQGFDFSDLGDIFSGFGDVFSGGGRGAARVRKGADIQVDVEMTLGEAAFGINKTIRLYKHVACDVCTGTGVEVGSKMIKCKECGGKGQVQTVQRTVFGAFQTNAECSTCEGKGEIPEKICRHCCGRGLIKKQEEISVKIPAGIDTNEVIRVTGHGEAAAKGGRAGDLYIRVHVKKDPRFTRNDFDLYTKKKISFTQAALGGTVEIDTLEGKAKIAIPEGTQSGQQIRLKNQGVTRLNSSGRGDLYVEVIVETPTKLSKKQKELLREFSKE